MLYLKADEPRTLTFEVDIKGVGTAELKGFVRLLINDTEHGFPISIEDGFIQADIPPLTEIVRLKTMEDGDIIQAKLQLMTDQHIFTPWEGEVKISVPMGIKAKLSSEAVKSESRKMVAKVVESAEDDSYKKIGKKSTNVSKATVQEFDTSEEKMLKKNQSNYKKELMAMVADTIKQMDLVPAGSQPQTLMEDERTTKRKQVSKKITEQAKLNKADLMKKKLLNITQEGVYKYMENAGTKNPKIQELIYDQAAAAAMSAKPYKILQQVVKILQKRK